MNRVFTSQHVSINSHQERVLLLLQRYLHPNMYLLILVSISTKITYQQFTSQHVSINSYCVANVVTDYNDIYIPTCIY